MSRHIGIDASKDTLVIATWPLSTIQNVANTPAGISRWLKALPMDAVVGIESTGACHGLFADMAASEGRTVYVLNPRDVHHYALGVGQRGKTDRQDAEVIARYVAHEHTQLRAYRVAAPAVRSIQSLLQQRAQVVASRSSLRQSLALARGLSEQLKDAVAALNALVRRIDALVLLAIEEEKERSTRWQRLQTIPGVGPVTAAWLTSLFERIRFEKGDAVVAFSGLDPRPCDSGRKRGRRVLTKRGPPELRRLLYLAAMSFARCPMGKILRERYGQRALSTTAIYVILARKLLRIAWTLDRNAVDFDPSQFKACATT